MNPTSEDTELPSLSSRTDSYLRRLLILLASALFFQGYDTQLFSILLPDIQSSFHIGEATLGVAHFVTDLGGFGAFFVGRLADRFGRRPVLLWSVAVYTVFTALSAVSWDIWSLTGFQLGARLFLGAEYAVSITMVVEEFSARRRGRALATLTACSAFGSIAVGVLVGAGLLGSALGWRAFYLIGLLPLAALTYYRRQISESRRFHLVRHERPARPALLAPWARRYRRNLLLLGLTHLLIGIPHFGALAWLAFHGEREIGLTTGDIALFLVGAYGLGLSGFFVCGWAMRRFGRRPTALAYGVGSMVTLVVLYQTTSVVIAFVAMFCAVFGTLGMIPVLAAFDAELFPTEIRSTAVAWIRNVFEASGAAGGPALVGLLGDHTTGLIGNVGDTVSVLCVLFLPALVIIWRFLPETNGRITEAADHTALGGHPPDNRVPQQAGTPDA
ncbi:MFS transporter [Nocardia sp. CA-135953]|uniref:MFS transporter n=1 Tax=Nocardia sp. CA-135953 TaxID=3239978 RepID=UPI003D967F19